jgi:hypothetical protein
MKLKDALGQAWHAAQASPIPPTPSTTRATGPLPVPSAGRVVKSGVAAGATVVALSAASALTSRVRRRMEGT